MAGYNTGDVIINTCVIGGVSLKGMFHSAKVSENMLNKIAGSAVTIKVLDTSDICEKIKPGAPVYFAFSVPGGLMNTYNMLVHSKQEIQDPGTNTMKSKMFDIHCVSREAIFAQAGRVEKKYTAPASSIVQQVFTEYCRPTKGVRVSSSTGNPESWAGKDSPAKIINQMLQRAVSPMGVFAWFENRDAFNFITWQEAFSNAPLKNLKQHNTSGHDFLESRHDMILYHKVNKKGNASDALIGGQTKVIQYDTRSRKNEEKIYPGFVPSFMDAAFGAAISGIVTKIIRVPHASKIGSQANRNMFFELLHKSTQKIASLLQQTTTISVPGDTLLTVGKTVNLSIPKRMDVDSPSLDYELSGIHLIVTLDHVIHGPDAKPRYTTQMQLIKDDI